MIDARIIADTYNVSSQTRLTTFVLTFPRMILAEFNTHRMLSRNSASSRAIPSAKMIENVINDPFVPLFWPKQHKGMQAQEYFDEGPTTIDFEARWLEARDDAVHWAETLANNDVSKQITNRLLEPFLWHTCIASGTEWENFFALRVSPMAEPHMEMLAQHMLGEYNISTPQRVHNGEWHIPFGDQINSLLAVEQAGDLKQWAINPELPEYLVLGQLKIMIATARCARVSYNNFDGTRNYKEDLALTMKLAKAGHWSPFEHCAQAIHPSFFKGKMANFKGFAQYRSFFPNENITNSGLVTPIV